MSEATLKLVTFDPQAEAKANVVAIAQDILQMAEAGELVDLSFFAATLEGSIRTGFTATDDQFRRIAACSRLLWRLHQKSDEQAGDD